jgi:hypothetical protein
MSPNMPLVAVRREEKERKERTENRAREDCI